jgi:hypothetical protein
MGGFHGDDYIPLRRKKLRLALYRMNCHTVSYLRYPTILALNYIAHYHEVSNAPHKTTSNTILTTAVGS